MTDQLLIAPGPGHIDWANVPYGVHAFVGLELVYLNMAPSMTRAIIHLKATDADEGIADIDIGCELTKEDLELMRGTIDALLTAIEEDDNG